MPDSGRKLSEAIYFFFFFFLCGGNPHGHQVASARGGGERKRRSSARLQPTKTSTMTVPVAIERGPGTGASDTPGPSRAQNASSPGPPCKAVWFPYRTAWRSRGADLSAPKFDPHEGGAAALERLVQARPRRLPRPRRSILSGWELRTLALSATSFRNITCSRKEVTALLPLSLANSAPRIAGGERSHPISTMRLRHGRAHARQNSNVCRAESTLVSRKIKKGVTRSKRKK